ncbi:MAG: hypothetical protein AB1626_00840 [Candidatus Micrarchaeota archaeon]
MDFEVLRLTANGNLLLRSPSNEGVAGKMTLYAGRKAVAEVFDTIASVDNPFYLAKPHAASTELVGKTLSSKKVK